MIYNNNKIYKSKLSEPICLNDDIKNVSFNGLKEVCAKNLKRMF